MKKNDRKSNIELLRIILMIMIIIHHFVYHNARTIEMYTIVDLIFFPAGPLAVMTFMIITGFFMVEKKIKTEKVLKTIASVYFYTIGIKVLLQGKVEENITNEMYYLPIINKTYWFITDYIYIYLSIPIINILIKNTTKKQYKTILLIMPLLFWTNYIRVIKNESYALINSAIILLYAYILGRIYTII